MSKTKEYPISTLDQRLALAGLFSTKKWALALPIINSLASTGLSVITLQYINEHIALPDTAREAGLLDKTTAIEFTDEAKRKFAKLNNMSFKDVTSEMIFAALGAEFSAASRIDFATEKGINLSEVTEQMMKQAFEEEIKSGTTKLPGKPELVN